MKSSAAGLVRLFLLILIAAQAAFPASRQEWARFTVERGLRPGQTVSMEEWNRFLDKLGELERALPAVGRWDAASLWDGILIAQGIEPKREWAQEEWRQLVQRLMAAHPAVPPFSAAGPAQAAPPGDAASAEAARPVRPNDDPLLVLPTGSALVPVTPAEPGPTGAIASGPPDASAPDPRTGAPARKVSLDLREMDVVEVLKLLSRQYGMNIVVGKNVSGRVTVFLNNVDAWDALRTILETRDLAYVQEKDLIKVMTAPDYERVYGRSFGDKTEVREIALSHVRADEAKAFLEPFKSRVGRLVSNDLRNTLIVEDTPDRVREMEERIRESDVPLETRVFALSHGTVDDILPKVAPLAGKDFGSMQADKRTNSILVKANPARMAEIARVVESLDARSKAVLIEAKIVQVLLSDSHQWGVNWQYVFQQMVDGYPAAGSLSANLLTVPLESVTADAGGRSSARGVTGNLRVAQLPHSAQFSGIVNALETMGRTNMLSAPRIMALNNREASIHIGTKEPIITRNIINPGSTTSQPIVTEEVRFEPVGVKLSVTPVIGADGYITLKIRPEVSAVESTINTSNGSSIPIVRLSEAETSVLVKDGVTIVIGGLIEDRKSKSDARVPFLGRIPLIGLPFRSRTQASQKTELVFFLTPRITSGDATAPEAEASLGNNVVQKGRKKGAIE